MVTKVKQGVIADAAVGTAQLAGDSVTAGKIVDGAVGASEIGADAVTASEIAADAVGTSEIGDGTVTADDLAATLDLSGKTLTLPAANTPAFTKSYTSPNQAITAAGALTLAHGLGVMPKLIQLRLKCLTAEGDYSVGDELPINPNVSSFGAAAGTVVVPDATNLNVRFGAGAPVYSTLNKTTGAAFSPTPANWALVVKAWA